LLGRPDLKIAFAVGSGLNEGFDCSLDNDQSVLEFRQTIRVLVCRPLCGTRLSGELKNVNISFNLFSSNKAVRKQRGRTPFDNGFVIQSTNYVGRQPPFLQSHSSRQWLPIDHTGV
jgi:hypothetical protein